MRLVKLYQRLLANTSVFQCTVSPGEEPIKTQNGPWNVRVITLLLRLRLVVQSRKSSVAGN
jgi:hypothetical protein